MAKERLSHLQKFVLWRCLLSGYIGTPLDFMFTYWGKIKGEEGAWNDDNEVDRRSLRRKHCMPLLRSIRSLEKKGLIFVGLDEDATIRLTDEGQMFAEQSEHLFKDTKTGITIRPLKFRPPKISKGTSDQDPALNNLENKMEQIAKALKWITGEIQRLNNEREFWGEAFWHRAFRSASGIIFTAAFTNFILTINRLKEKGGTIRPLKQLTRRKIDEDPEDRAGE